MKKLWGSSIARCNIQRASLVVLLFLAWHQPARAQFTFTTNNGALTLISYTGPDRAVTIPATNNGLSVVSIGDCAFSSNSSLVSVTIPASVTNFALPSFCSCSNMTAAFFEGDAPLDGWPGGPSVFWRDGKPTIYYLQGKNGWGAALGQLLTVQWNPQVLEDLVYITTNNTVAILTSSLVSGHLLGSIPSHG